MAIELIQHVGGEIETGAAIRVQIENVTLGNMLIACVVARGIITVDDTWTLIGSGATIENGSITQPMYYYRKEADGSGTQSLAVTENVSNGRVYIGIMEFANISSVSPFCDIANNSAQELQAPDKGEGACLLWGMHSVTWQTNNSTSWETNPDDIAKIDYDFKQDRLCNFFDTGNGQVARRFSIKTETYQIGILALTLAEVQNYFLIRSDDIIYTFSGGSLTALDTTEMESAVFRAHGCLREEIDFAVLQALHNPEIYEWQAEADKSIAGIDVSMTGIAVPCTVTQTFLLNRPDIKGIQSITAVYTGDPTVTLSVDGGVTYWAYLEGAWQEMSGTDGMSIASLELVTPEQWAELVTGAAELTARALIIPESSVENITITYVN